MLLFDENLSFRLVRQLDTTFANSRHVSDVGLLRASDQDIWEFAKANGLALVSKDTDFVDLAILRGRPPAIVVLEVGNADTETIARLLATEASTVIAFVASGNEAVLALSLRQRRPM